jgi:hypothetical protein
LLYLHVDILGRIGSGCKDSEWQSRHGAPPSKAIHTLLGLVPEVIAENIWVGPLRTFIS